ncbi:MAG: alpha/beta fold hydrolase, partial [Burkholderiaceae bacterium]
MTQALFVQTSGRDTGNWLVLMHSLGATHRLWDVQMPVFEQQFRVLRLDLPGHGASPLATAAGLDAMADAVLEALNAHGVDQAYFCGLSLGGVVAQSHAVVENLLKRAIEAGVPASQVAKVPKDEIKTRVGAAARLLDLEPYLDRKPGALSGGQRQRVAMGRAIVREPQAFLMDEPLSNLDAKLRVQTRAQIATLQRRLGTTTVYVTHDQVEAMTLGDRVALLKDGEIQQVDSP